MVVTFHKEMIPNNKGFRLEKHNDRNQIDDIGVDWRIILKEILKESYVKA
jgi:hypothetical protein